MRNINQTDSSSSAVGSWLAALASLSISILRQKSVRDPRRRPYLGNGLQWLANDPAPPTVSFPLDCSGRFGGIVINHPINALHLVDDPSSGTRQEACVERIYVGCHAIR